MIAAQHQHLLARVGMCPLREEETNRAEETLEEEAVVAPAMTPL